jgi:hypothetical protein
MGSRVSWVLAVVLAVAPLGFAACGDDLDPPGQPGAIPDAAPDADPEPDGGAAPGIDREHAGGAPTAIELSGDRAYLAVGPRLAIWRLPDAGAARLLGESEPLRGVVTGLAIAGQRAFVAERIDLDGRIHVLDVSDPAMPVETAVFTLGDGPTQPRGMVVLGDRLFVADFEQGVAEVDVSDPDAPEVGRIVPLGGVADLEVVGARLYYFTESFFGGRDVGALDLGGDLVDLGFVSLPGAKGAAVTSEHLVVSAGTDGIHVHDLTDPAQPVERFAHVLPEGGPFSRAVATTGATAWIPAEDGLYVLDLEAPDAITRTGPLALATQGANAASAGDALAVVSDRGQLLTFDVAGEPALRASTDVSCAPTASASPRRASSLSPPPSPAGSSQGSFPTWPCAVARASRSSWSCSRTWPWPATWPSRPTGCSGCASTISPTPAHRLLSARSTPLAFRRRSPCRTDSRTSASRPTAALCASSTWPTRRGRGRSAPP